MAEPVVLPKTRESARRSPRRGVTCETWPGWSRSLFLGGPPARPGVGVSAGRRGIPRSLAVPRVPARPRQSQRARLLPQVSPPRSLGAGRSSPSRACRPPACSSATWARGGAPRRDPSSASASSRRPLRRRPLSPHPATRGRHALCLARPSLARGPVPFALQGQRQDSFPAEGKGAREP